MPSFCLGVRQSEGAELVRVLSSTGSRPGFRVPGCGRKRSRWFGSGPWGRFTLDHVEGRDRPDRQGYEHEDADEEDRVELLEQFGYMLSRKRGEGTDRARGEGEAGEGEQE